MGFVMDRIVHLGRRHSIQEGETFLTPFGQKLHRLFVDIGIISAWPWMYLTRWDMIRRTFYRVVLGKDWWPER